ncbi:hypothetical protein WJX81_001888 [Elliptochloris bilobata]|uniref:Bromo domain-containing protein n=1 Tax=Elliptochloris bilobata TaxID=381761 RepID=A0AAW1SJA8_9CHLO
MQQGQRALPPVPESQKVWFYTDPQATARQYAEGQGSLKWLLQEHRHFSAAATFRPAGGAPRSRADFLREAEALIGAAEPPDRAAGPGPGRGLGREAFAARGYVAGVARGRGGGGPGGGGGGPGRGGRGGAWGVAHRGPGMQGPLPYLAAGAGICPPPLLRPPFPGMVAMPPPAHAHGYPGFRAPAAPPLAAHAGEAAAAPERQHNVSAAGLQERSVPGSAQPEPLQQARAEPHAEPAVAAGHQTPPRAPQPKAPVSFQVSPLKKPGFVRRNPSFLPAAAGPGTGGTPGPGSSPPGLYSPPANNGSRDRSRSSSSGGGSSSGGSVSGTPSSGSSTGSGRHRRHTTEHRMRAPAEARPWARSRSCERRRARRRSSSELPAGDMRRDRERRERREPDVEADARGKGDAGRRTSIEHGAERVKRRRLRSPASRTRSPSPQRPDRDRGRLPGYERRRGRSRSPQGRSRAPASPAPPSQREQERAELLAQIEELHKVVQGQIAEVALAYHADWPQMDLVACYELGHDVWHAEVTKPKPDFSAWDAALSAADGEVGAEAAADGGGAAEAARSAGGSYHPWADPAQGPPVVEREEWPPSPNPVPVEVPWSPLARASAWADDPRAAPAADAAAPEPMLLPVPAFWASALPVDEGPERMVDSDGESLSWSASPRHKELYDDAAYPVTGAPDLHEPPPAPRHEAMMSTQEDAAAWTLERLADAQWAGVAPAAPLEPPSPPPPPPPEDPEQGEDWHYLVVEDARLGLCEGSHALRTLRRWAAERGSGEPRWGVPVQRHSDGLWLPLLSAPVAVEDLVWHAAAATATGRFTAKRSAERRAWGPAPPPQLGAAVRGRLAQAALEGASGRALVAEVIHAVVGAAMRRRAAAAAVKAAADTERSRAQERERKRREAAERERRAAEDRARNEAEAAQRERERQEAAEREAELLRQQAERQREAAERKRARQEQEAQRERDRAERARADGGGGQEQESPEADAALQAAESAGVAGGSGGGGSGGEDDGGVTDTARQRARAAVQARAAESAMRELLRVVRAFDRTKCDGLFAEPVTDDIAPGYSAKISRPMDLKTLAHSLEKKHAFTADLAGLEDFHGRVQLIASNALEYNPTDTGEYECAAELRDFSRGEYERLRREVQSAGFIARR